MMTHISLALGLGLLLAAGPAGCPVPASAPSWPTAPPLKKPVLVGASQFKVYMPLLAGKRVGLVVNQTSRVGGQHLVDTLRALHVNITAIFAPEHGFRGEKTDGAPISDGRDARTGLAVRSVYGSTKKPTPAMLADVDVIIYDIQDVGVRFYTFISTLHYVMEAAAEQDKTVLVFDRPNPNGAFVDGPVLAPNHRTFVGLDPLPVCYGLTVGELATMINEEKWLAGQRQCRLKIIPMTGDYTHAMAYPLPVRPSPNLPTARAVTLYPSLCLFEGTNVSVGRGTDRPFEIIGAPTQPATRPYQFTPNPNAASPSPPLKGQICYGLDLHQHTPQESVQFFTLKYLLDFYQQSTDKPHFFTKYFEDLAGTDSLRAQVIAGRSEGSIRASWEPQLGRFKQLRKKYLLYPER